MRKLAAIPFLILYSCIIIEPKPEIIPETTFSPIDDVSGDYTTETTLIDISDIPCWEHIMNITDGNLTLEFNHTLYKSGFGCFDFDDWGTFPEVESSNPHMLSTDEEGSISIWLSEPVSTFGLEVKPGSFGDYFITVDFYSKTKLIGSVKKPNAGVYESPEAVLFAASTNDSFERIVISGFSSESGFDMAQFRYVLE